MDGAQWFTVARDAVMLVITVLVFYWGRDRKSGEQAIKDALALRDQRLDALERRFEQAGEKQSDMGSRVQGLIGTVAVQQEQIAEFRRTQDRRIYDRREEDRQ